MTAVILRFNNLLLRLSGGLGMHLLEVKVEIDADYDDIDDDNDVDGVENDRVWRRDINDAAYMA